MPFVSKELIKTQVLPTVKQNPPYIIFFFDESMPPDKGLPMRIFLLVVATFLLFKIVVLHRIYYELKLT